MLDLIFINFAIDFYLTVYESLFFSEGKEIWKINGCSQGFFWTRLQIFRNFFFFSPLNSLAHSVIHPNTERHTEKIWTCMYTKYAFRMKILRGEKRWLCTTFSSWYKKFCSAVLPSLIHIFNKVTHSKHYIPWMKIQLSISDEERGYL